MSRRLSPFESDDDPAENVSVSADSRRAADSNESLVLVESSKNTEATVLPLSAGTFGIGLFPISANLSVNSRISSSCSLVVPSIPRRCLLKFGGVSISQLIFSSLLDLPLLQSHLLAHQSLSVNFCQHNPVV